MYIYSVWNNFKYFNIISSLLLISSVIAFHSAVYTSTFYTKYLQYTFIFFHLLYKGSVLNHLIVIRCVSCRIIWSTPWKWTFKAQNMQ